MGLYYSTPSYYFVTKINCNQLNVPDYIALHILDYLNDCARAQTLYNPLRLSLVCSYWMMYLVPKVTRHIVTTFEECAFISQFPISLQQLYTSQGKHCDLKHLLAPLRKLTLIDTTLETGAGSSRVGGYYPFPRWLTKLLFSRSGKSTDPDSDHSSYGWSHFDALASHWWRCKSLTLVNYFNQFPLKIFVEEQFQFENLRVYPSHLLFKAAKFSIYCSNLEVQNLAVRFPYRMRSRSSFQYSIMPYNKSYSCSVKHILSFDIPLVELESLHLHCNGISNELYEESNNWQLTKQTIEYLKNLRHLKLEKCYIATANPIFGGLDNLVKLCIDGVLGDNPSSNNDESMLIKELGALKQLQVLKLKNILSNMIEEFILAIDDMPRLSRLSINCQTMATKLLYEYLSSGAKPALKHLSISTLRHASFYQLLSNTETLEIITINNIDNPTTGQQVANAILNINNNNNNKKCKSLKILNADFIPDEMFQCSHILVYPKQFKSTTKQLTKINTKLITDEIVQQRFREYRAHFPPAV